MTINRRLTAAALALLGAGLIAAPAAARGGHGYGPDAAGKGGPGMGAAAMFERFDVDDDGVVTQEEFETYHAQRLSDADANKDGKISLDEFKAAADARRDARREARDVRKFEFLDTDDDGVLSLEELDARAMNRFKDLDRDGDGNVSKDDLPSMHGGRGGRGKGPRGKGAAFMLEQSDADSDGVITREEFDTFHADRFGDADANKDGKISLEEFKAADTARREARRADRAEAMFEFLDTDRDGVLTVEEMNVRADANFQRMDRNGDGTVTKDDMPPARHGGRGGFGPKHMDR